MTININLTVEQAKGIKAYLLATGGQEAIKKKDIDIYIKGIVWSTLETEAVSDYISDFSK